MNQAALRIGLVTDHTYLPDRVGGRESSIHDLALALQASGQHVRVIANRGPRLSAAALILPRLRWRRFYPVDRVSDEREHAIRLLRRDVIDFAVYNCERMENWAAADPEVFRRQVFYVRDAKATESSTFGNFPSHTRFVANSNFIAAKVQVRTSATPLVVHPLIDPSQYWAESSHSKVTFINPVEEKGFSLAIQVAQLCPEIPFQFVEGWPQDAAGLAAIRARLADCPNVLFRRTVVDMRDIYRDTGVLLAPSQCEEGFGRVAVEAQISGIPVIASNTGGLPEAVGEGGVLVSPTAPAETWAAHLRKIWHDRQAWADLSTQARQNAAHFLENSRVSTHRIIAELRRT